MQPSTPSGAINWQPAPGTVVPAKKPRYFFVGMAVFFFIVVAAGFGPNVQLMRTGVMKPHWSVHVHGAIMTGWLLLFFIQSVLVARKNIALHKKLGIFSFFWGVAVCGVMISASIHILVFAHPPKDDFLFDLILMELNGFISFTSFFVGGILTRKTNPLAHKRFLIMATIVLLQAAIDRNHWLPMFGLQYPTIYFIYLDVFFVVLAIYDLLSIRRVHGVTWKGALFVILLQCGVVAVMGSPAWHTFWYEASLPIMEKTIEVHPSSDKVKMLEGYYGNQNFNMQILQDSGQLCLLIPGQPKFAMGATSDSTWFFRAINPTVTFRKNAAGNVTTMLFKQGYTEEIYPRMP